MLPNEYLTLSVADATLIIRKHPCYANQIEEIGNNTRIPAEVISSKLSILFKNQLIYAVHYPKEQCVVFETHPKKVFKEHIALALRAIKETLKVSEFYLKEQYEKEST